MPACRSRGAYLCRDLGISYNCGMTTPSGQIQLPYGSANDLPSFQELTSQIQGLKPLTRFIARKQHSELLQLEHKLAHLVDVVDRFYDRLGPRNWIFHDSVNIAAVEAILDQTNTGDEAEQRFIELYRDDDYLAFWNRQLDGVDGLRERTHQIQRAREHYSAEQFDSAVLHLIAVIDGFVNDFEPDVRRDLSSRDPDTMTAWDSVVGHHLGLTNALKAYQKTIKKRVDDEVYELHRHGIVHGSITRFDNVVVATKAWNMLFAVADWAAGTENARQPEAPTPTIRETIQQMGDTARIKKMLDAWNPTHLSDSDAGFEDHEIHSLTVEFLTNWRARNFGALARFPTRQFGSREKTPSQMAGQLRDEFKGFVLSDFRVTALENIAPAIWVSKGEAAVNGMPGTFECRWTIDEADGTLGFGSDSAVRRLVFCDPNTVWKRSI